MFDQNLILVLFLTSIALVNRGLYYYDESKNKRRKVESLKSFSYIHKYLRLSTFIVAILSWINDRFNTGIFSKLEICFVFKFRSIS